MVWCTHCQLAGHTIDECRTWSGLARGIGIALKAAAPHPKVSTKFTKKLIDLASMLISYLFKQSGVHKARRAKRGTQKPKPRKCCILMIY
jgi:hypothetical protein